MASQSSDHHRRSVRLHGYDYRWPEAYFVTICTYRQRCVLGQVAREEMQLSAWGKLVQEERLRTATLRSDVTLDVLAVMPKRLHGIIVLEGRGTAAPCPYDAPRRFGQAQSGSSATIVWALKSVLTRRVNARLGTPGASFWQRNCYEHVIRDAYDWERIAAYVVSNPALWALDRPNGAPQPLCAPAASEDGLS